MCATVSSRVQSSTSLYRHDDCRTLLQTLKRKLELQSLLCPTGPSLKMVPFQRVFQGIRRGDTLGAQGYTSADQIPDATGVMGVVITALS